MATADETFLFSSFDDWDAQDAAEELALRLEELGFTGLVIDAAFVDTDAIVYYVENSKGKVVKFAIYLADASDDGDPDTDDSDMEGMVIPMAAIIDPFDDGEYLEFDLSDTTVEIDPECPIHIPDVFDLSWMNVTLAKSLLSMGRESLLEDRQGSELEPGSTVRSRGGKMLKSDSGALRGLPIHSKTNAQSAEARALYRRCQVLCQVQGW